MQREVAFSSLSSSKEQRICLLIMLQVVLLEAKMTKKKSQFSSRLLLIL